MLTVSWTGGGGNLDWNNQLNWSGGQVPGPNDDVLINVPGPVTITHSSGNDTIHSLNLAATDTLSMTGGTFLFVSQSMITGTLQVLGGSNLEVQAGLTLNGTLNLGATDGSSSGTAYFDDTQTLAGGGKVVFGSAPLGGNGIFSHHVSTSSAKLTIGPNITISGVNGSVAGLNIGADSIANAGTISLPTGSLTIGGLQWTNTGTITVGNTAHLVGMFASAGLGTLNAHGATVDLDGTLNISDTFTLAPNLGNWNLTGGTISGGTLASSGGAELTLTGADGELLGLTIAAGTTVDGTKMNSSVHVVNGLTLNGSLNLGADDGSTSARAYFDNTQTLAGAGTITFGGALLGSNGVFARDVGAGPAQMTIGAGITITGSNGSVAGISPTYDSVINLGKLNFANGSLSIGGASWKNSGTITVGGTVRLVGSFAPADLGTFHAMDATVDLDGTLGITDTFTLVPDLGNWNLTGGTISGGTLASSGESKLTLTGAGGTLSGLTIAAGTTVDGATTTSSVQVVMGLTLNGTLLLGATDGSTFAQVYFDNTQTLAGAGTIVFGGAVLGSNGIYANDVGAGPAQLTIGSGITITGGNGAVAASSPTYDSIINFGTLNFATGSLSIGGADWQNTGTIKVGGTARLIGSFAPADLGNFQATGATVDLQGTLAISGTFMLTPDLGNWNLAGGTISDGTLASGGEAELTLTGTGGVLSGLVIAAGTTIDGTKANSSSVHVVNGLTLNGSLLLGAADGNTSSLVYFDNTQTLAGTGTITFGGAPFGANGVIANDVGAGPTMLTIGAGIKIQGSSGTLIGSGYFSDSIVLQGTLQADKFGKSFTLGNGDLRAGTLSGFQSITVGNGESLAVDESLQISDGEILDISSASALSTTGNLLGSVKKGAAFQPQGTITLDGSGTEAAPQMLEAMSADAGANAAGYLNGFAYGNLTLSHNTYVKLVDQSDNSPGAGPEALYVNSLVVPAGCTLNLNGLHLYVRDSSIAPGSVIGGTISVVPDGGQFALNNIAAGSISNTGQTDNWTFFGRAGDAVVVVLDPGSAALGGPISPTLGWGQVQLFNSSHQLWASATSTSVGDPLVLSSGQLPADGTYTIAVAASAGQAASTGNYVLAAWNAAPTVNPLNVNQTINGRIAEPYATDQWTFTAAANTSVQFNLLATSTDGLSFTLSGPGGNVGGFTNLTSSSQPVTLTAAGTYTLTASGSAGVTGSFAFQLAQSTQTALAIGGQATGTFTGSNQPVVYRVAVPASQSLTLSLNDPTTTDSVEIYAQFGSPPTRQSYDYRFGNPGPSQTLVVPNATPGTWYFLVDGETINRPVTYTLSAAGSPTNVATVTPTHSGNSSPATLELSGAGFTADSTVLLVASNGATTYAPTSFSVDSYTQITATFPAGLPAGKYSIRVTTDANTATLPASFQLTAGGAANFSASLILPSALGRHQLATIYVKYQNDGSVATSAPLLVIGGVKNSNPAYDDRPLLTLDQSLLTQGFWTSSVPDGFTTSLSILASGRTPGVLQPGESETIPVYYAGLLQPWSNNGDVPFNLGIVKTTDTTPIDWNSLKSNLQPSWISSDAWGPIFNGVVSQAGSTSGSYVQMLDANAQYLGQLGETVTDVGQLWNLSILQANGLNPLSTLAAATDVAMVAPGLSLTFDRSFGETINSRNQSGLLGNGWTDPWQTSLVASSDGTVVITSNDGDQFRYQPDSRSAGKYFSAAGDTNTLTALSNGIYVWQDASGNKTGFRADGKLDYVADTNGNKITAGYTAGLLTTLTHSSGQKLTIAYQSGLIHTVTDSFGRQAVYLYTGNNLTSVQTPAGTTIYSYYTGGSAATNNALEEVISPDGVHQYFKYDPAGRLITVAGDAVDGNNDKVTYTYDGPGEVTATDALSHATRTYYDYRGLPVKSQDALGYITTVTYDSKTLLVNRIVDPLGQTQSFTYDAAGNLTSSTDSLGNKTTFTYGNLNRLTSLKDAKGNTTTYAYDPSGNLLSTTYPNGSAERATFDPLGDPKSFTNRDGQAISYTYNSSGQITSQTFPDGTHTDFTYDAHGNLQTATDATGTITFCYDAADNLTKVLHPDGTYLTFGASLSGRRNSMTDNTGFTVNYHYDAAGRLQDLTDGGGIPIVTYSYDQVGRLVTKTNANHTHTTISYDADGNIWHLINYAADGTTVNSRFDYTYDALGRRWTMTTLDGTWTYTYDRTGQLVHAVFASTNPSIPSQDLVYQYDAVGNRISTVLNGATTAYATNNLNEYTSVGGVTQTYDADGNLLSDGTNTYHYDVLNRLTSVTNATGVTSYTYDALGNRSTSSASGNLTRYLNDPTGVTGVVSETDTSTNQVTHDVYGAGLVSRMTNDGTYFFDFDATGSTTGITSSSGSYLDSYAYNPFGILIQHSEAIPNTLLFVAEQGVTAESNGIASMHARDFNYNTGRFQQPDPLRLLGGSTNIYQYALNSPVDYFDPAGLCSTAQGAVLGGGFGAFTSDKPAVGFGVIGAVAGAVVGGTVGAIGGAVAGAVGGGILTLEIGALPGVILGTIVGAVEGGVALGAEGAELGWAGGYAFGSSPIVQGWARTQFGSYTLTATGAWVGANVCSTTTTPNVKSSMLQENIVNKAASVDPNDKLGPVGYGTQNFVSANETLPYRIDFENASTATAPAQTVTITDQLDSRLDWSTFRLSEIAFGDTTLTIPPGTQHFQATVPMTYNGQTFDVEVEAGIHGDTGQVYATFQSIDPATQLPPDVLTGFLPPEPANDTGANPDPGSGRGQGHISYTVSPLAGLSTGTQIRNVAEIIFDQNQAIATDQVSETDPTQGHDLAKQALVTIDSVKPTSRVTPLTPTQRGGTFPVTWSGSDDAGGSGVQSYNVFVSVDGGAYMAWQTATMATTGVYTALGGTHTYAFYSQAVDNVGNTEDPHATADTTTTVASGTTHVSSVIVDGTTWSAGYLSGLQTAGLDDGRGYRIPAGSSAQLTVLPWVDLNQIRIVFDGSVNVQQSSLLVTGQNTTHYSFTSFAYDAAAHTATWTLAQSIGADKVLIDLQSTGAAAVTDVSGNALDGEWTNAVSGYPSGNGVPGGDFYFRFNVLPADVNQDGAVNGLDIAQVASHWLQSGGGDANGDGVANGLDIAAIASHWLTSFSALPGDANGDGVTNGLDIALVASHWLGHGPAGDVNNDAVVNGLDIALIASHWLARASAGSSAPAALAPVISANAQDSSLAQATSTVAEPAIRQEKTQIVAQAVPLPLPGSTFYEPSSTAAYSVSVASKAGTEAVNASEASLISHPQSDRPRSAPLSRVKLPPAWPRNTADAGAALRATQRASHNQELDEGLLVTLAESRWQPAQ